MMVDSQAASHYVLLLGIPERYRREEIISFFGDVVSLDSFKMLKYFDQKAQRQIKLGIVQMHSVFDISRAACRYLGERDSSMENLVLKGDLRVVEAIVNRPTNLKISFRSEDESAARAVLGSVLANCGEMTEVSTEYEDDQVVCSFQVASAFSMSNVCTGQSFSAGDIKFHVEFEEEFLCDREFKELLLRAQLDLNRLQHYHQGLGLQATNSLRELSLWQSKVTVIKDIISELFEAHEIDSLIRQPLEQADDDRLSALFEDEEEDPDDEPPLPRVSPFSFFSTQSCEQFLEERSLDSGGGSVARPRSPDSPDSTCLAARSAEAHGRPAAKPCAEQPRLSAEEQDGALVSVEDRIIELVARLQGLGCKVDSGFFEGVYRKIDPSTEDGEFLRAGLKILKTKMRKARRREKKKHAKKAAKGEPPAECSEEEDSEDLRAEGTATNTLAAEAARAGSASLGLPTPKQQVKVVTQCSSVASKLLAGSPPEWVQFIKNLSPGDGSPPAAKTRLVGVSAHKLFSVSSPATRAAGLEALQRNEHDTPWLEHLRGLRSRKHQTPKGWPDSVPENLRLNKGGGPPPAPAQFSSRNFTKAPSPLLFSHILRPSHFLTTLSFM